jgi:hypothetical protein
VSLRIREIKEKRVKNSGSSDSEWTKRRKREVVRNGVRKQWPSKGPFLRAE